MKRSIRLLMSMTVLGLIGTAWMFPAFPVRAGEPGFTAVKAKAEKLYEEGAYGAARKAYKTLDLKTLTKDQARWVEFRLADTMWRTASIEYPDDDSRLELARAKLEALAARTLRITDRDETWADIQLSLGDFWWTRRNWSNWDQAGPYYDKALEWWAGRPKGREAADHYLGVLWSMAAPTEDDWSTWRSHPGDEISRDALENALRIATTTEQKIHLHYLLARNLVLKQKTVQPGEVEAQFEAVLQAGKTSKYYDDALYQYACWFEKSHKIQEEDGIIDSPPDYARTLALYRRYLKEFKKGEGAHWKAVKSSVEGWTGKNVAVRVRSAFLPGSLVRFDVEWRNVESIRFTLHKADLMSLGSGKGGWDRWNKILQKVNLNPLPVVKTWTKKASARQDIARHSDTVTLDKPLPRGAYVLDAKSGEEDDRALVLVTDAALVMQATPERILIYACDAATGAPISGARVRIRWGKKAANLLEKRTGKDGTAVFQPPVDLKDEHIRAILEQGDRQAYVIGAGSGIHRRQIDYGVYAFTDRPAYRPGETAHLKVIVRRFGGGRMTTPADMNLHYTLEDPTDTTVRRGTLKLNAFGSAWTSFDLPSSWRLGPYTIRLYGQDEDEDDLGQAELFRLEEYKLPEFKVKVTTEGENVEKSAYQPGDTVKVVVQADYFSGGGVPNADVSLTVFRRFFRPSWLSENGHPWEETDSYDGGGRFDSSQIEKARIQTGASGRAVYTFQVPAGGTQDYDYEFLAEVTDASRRSVSGRTEVRVSTTPYWVTASTGHSLFNPGQPVTATFKTRAADGGPVPAKGIFTVSRDVSREMWIAPDGREVRGKALLKLKKAHTIFPPPPKPPCYRAWQLQTMTTERKVIERKTVSTDANGEVEVTFTPRTDGVYHVSWSGSGKEASHIRTVKNVWVCGKSSDAPELSNDSLQIIPDRDEVKPGQSLEALILTPAPGRRVLVSVMRGKLQNYRLIQLEGTARRISIPVGDTVPQVIRITAECVHKALIEKSVERISVLPVQHFLGVSLKTDGKLYKPGGEAAVTVTARDRSGAPVRAEVALGAADDSIYAYQKDYAGDPRSILFDSDWAYRYDSSTPVYSSFGGLSYMMVTPSRYPSSGAAVRGAPTIARGVVGRVTDDQGNPVPGAVVQVTGTMIGGSRGTVSNVDGYYAVAVPPGGNYRIQVSAAGFITIVRKGLIVPPQSIVTADFRLPKGTSEVVVTAMAADVDRTTLLVAENQFIVNGIDIAEIPLERNSGGIAYMAPSIAGAPAATITVRHDFRTTAFWAPAVMTGKDGTAHVHFKLPQSLTAWRITARAATEGSDFGMAKTTVRTNQTLTVRFEGPRFLVAGDRAVLSAVVTNNGDQPVTVTPALRADGLKILGRVAADGSMVPTTEPVRIEAGGQARVDWRVSGSKKGLAHVSIEAGGSGVGDAMTRSLPVYEHGLEKFLAVSGKTRGRKTEVYLDLPAQRRPGSTRFSVQVTPSLAVTMLDALPYLIDYPWGCTEQTMSRFVPTIVTAETLKRFGIRRSDIAGRLFGGIEPSSAAETHKKGPRDLAHMDRMIKASLDRLYSLQARPEGGWGWWKDEEPDPWMTAYVLWGLSLARDAGVDVDAEKFEDAYDYLADELAEAKKDPVQQSWLLYAAARSYSRDPSLGDLPELQAALANVWDKRDRLNSYARAITALSAHFLGDDAKARVLVRALAGDAVVDSRPDKSILVRGAPPARKSLVETAHWGASGFWWNWYESPVESTAFALKALLAVDPKSPLVEPAVNWLIHNRRGAQWSNTRNTAVAILALDDYLAASRELQADVTYDVAVNGHVIARRHVSGKDIIAAPSVFEVKPEDLKNGRNTVTITRVSGNSPLYFSARASFFSTEEPVTPAGNELFVHRRYYRLVPHDTLLNGISYDRKLLHDGDTIRSGEVVECVLIVEAKNDYRYLVFEDLKPAGFEALNDKSGGWFQADELTLDAAKRLFGGSRKAAGAAAVLQGSDYTGRREFIYPEYRDRKAAFFVSRLPQGIWQITYKLRAETPGYFHALPALGYAMYVPEIRGNGKEERFTVKDAKVREKGE